MLNISNSPITFHDQQIANYFSLQPSQVKGSLNTETGYYEWALMWLVYYRYKLGLPKYIALNYFRYWLFHWGSIGIYYTNKFGWLAGNYGVSEVDVYFNPKVLTFANPFLDDVKVGIVGVNSCIIKLFDDYSGFLPFIKRTAEKLAACDKAMNVNLMVSSMGKLLGAPDKKIANTLKEALGDLTIGNPYVVMNSSDLENINVNQLVSDLGSDLIADKIQELKRSYVNEFLTLIGINNANLNKKERLVTDEVNANNDEVAAIPTIVIEDNLKPSLEVASQITGDEFSVALRNPSDVIPMADSLLLGGGEDVKS